MCSETTFIDEANVYVCDNCGAFAKEASEIKHHATCTPGESKRWEEFYADQEFDEDEKAFYGID